MSICEYMCVYMCVYVCIFRMCVPEIHSMSTTTWTCPHPLYPTTPLYPGQPPCRDRSFYQPRQRVSCAYKSLGVVGVRGEEQYVC